MTVSTGAGITSGGFVDARAGMAPPTEREGADAMTPEQFQWALIAAAFLLILAVGCAVGDNLDRRDSRKRNRP